MNVFIDMDSTMNNFAEGYINYYNEIYGTNHSITRDDLVDYEVLNCIPKIDGLDPSIARNAVFSTPGFWINIPIYSGVVDTVEWINKNFNTYILTSPWIGYKDCPKEKYIWIENHLPFFKLDKVIFCHDKHVVGGNSLLIDDHAKHINNFNGKTIRINYPYNKNTKPTYGADDWFEVLKIMKEIKFGEF